MRIFRRAGVVVIRGGLPAEACTRLHDACRRAESEVRILHPRGNRGPERCSFGKASVTGSTHHLPEWQALLGCEALLECLEVIFQRAESASPVAGTLCS